MLIKGNEIESSVPLEFVRINTPITVLAPKSPVKVIINSANTSEEINKNLESSQVNKIDNSKDDKQMTDSFGVELPSQSIPNSVQQTSNILFQRFPPEVYNYLWNNFNQSSSMSTEMNIPTLIRNLNHQDVPNFNSFTQGKLSYNGLL